MNATAKEVKSALSHLNLKRGAFAMSEDGKESLEKSLEQTGVQKLANNSASMRHGAALGAYIPGNVAAKASDKFGYMFPKIGAKCKIPYTPQNRQALETLGKNMLDLGLGAQNDPNRDGNIDAGYTYFGQFIDHDITLDVNSDINQSQDARTISNFRAPNFDLDSVYGRGPALDPHMYENPALGGRSAKLLIGQNSVAAAAATDFDLPRNSVGIAIIGDARNDENLFVAQLHLGFLKFHNQVVDDLAAADPAKSDSTLFREAQLETRRHYQFIVVNDFLRTLAGDAVVDDVVSTGTKFFKPQSPAMHIPTEKVLNMPVEFSVAAYRFGHSMIRDNYRFNQFFDTGTGFFWAFSFTKVVVPNNWIINWNSFFSHPGNVAVNKARKIDTRVALHMGHLDVGGQPNPNVMPTNFMAILSARNLVRSMALGVPTGQCVAKAMGVAPLTSAQLLTSPFATPDADQAAAHQNVVNALQDNNNFLLENTPLWFYILKEAEVLQNGDQLGPVGGRIITEVFLGFMKADAESILNNTAWAPTMGLVGSPKDYKIVDFLRFAGMLNIFGIN